MLKILSRVLITLLMIVSLTLIGGNLAQAPIPLPLSPTISRATGELIINPGFEIDNDGDNFPDGWIGENTDIPPTDKIKCNKPEKNKFFSHTGDCAFMFRGNSDGTVSSMKYVIIDTIAFVAGDKVVFGAYIDPLSGTTGSKFAQMTIRYTDGTRQKLILTIPPVESGTDKYRYLSQSIILPPIPITLVKLYFRYQGTSGKFLIDDSDLAVVPIDLTFTPTPDSFTATPTQGVITTSTASYTPTATPTFPTSTMILPTSTASSTPTLDPTYSQTPPTAIPSPSSTPIPNAFQLIASDGAEVGYFGFSSALDGNTIVIGATHKDVAYVFVRDGLAWIEQQQLTAGDGYPSDSFGHSVDVDGNTLVIGAFPKIGEYDRQGAVYVFTSNNGVWTEQQKLTANDGQTYDLFGKSVAISGDTLVVGASEADTNAVDGGAAYVFTRSGTVWTQQQKLIAINAGYQDWFGKSVDIDGNTIVVGAWAHDVGPKLDQGTAYIFARSGTVWTQQQQLIAGDGSGNDMFGYSVAIDGDTTVVGAYRDTIGANFEQGSVYVFTRSGTFWTQEQKLTPSNGMATDWFGWSVAIDTDTLVGGSNLDDIGPKLDQGSAQVFVRSGGIWTEQQKLTANDGEQSDLFGHTVAISGQTAVVATHLDDIGANFNQGSGWVFLIP